MNNLVSIIVPFFNAEKTLSDTLKCLERQTFQQIEIILVNDGSNDKSSDIAASFCIKDMRFKLFNTSNFGPGCARKFGLQKASGDYIFFLDSDDLIHGKTIEILLSELLKVNCDVSIARYETFVDCPHQKKDIVLQPTFLKHDDLIKEISLCGRIQNFFWGKLFRRNILFLEDFDQNKLLGEDITSMIKIFDKCSSGVFIDGTPLVFYKQNPLSLSKKLSYKKLNNYCDALLEKTDFIKNKYPEFYFLTFNSNIDFWFLIEQKYDLNRIQNIALLKHHIDKTSSGLRRKFKLFVANHPNFAHKLFKNKKDSSDKPHKRIAVINTYNRMSTGNVAKSIMDGVNNEYETKLFYGRCHDKWDNDSIFVGGSKIYNFVNNVFVKVTGKIGGKHRHSTKSLIKQLNDFNPDIIHLHNIHGNFLNYKMLFKYLKNKKVVVTMHDCFWLTGRCVHFIDDKVVCDLWKSGCIKCPHKKLYMATLCFDKAKQIFDLKQGFLKKCTNLKLVALSQWQKDLFEGRDVQLIPNGFDIKTDFVKKNNESNRLSIIGVSQVWTNSKGLTDFNYLADKLDPEKFSITLIGKRGKRMSIHKNIRLIENISKTDLLKLVTNSDIFVNPTYVDTFPTVLIESLACGTPIISYDVGGCKDIVGSSGFLIPRGNVGELLKHIISFRKSDFDSKQIQEHSKMFSKQIMVDRYRELYKEILNGE